MSYSRVSASALTLPEPSPEAAAWMAARATPGFKPRDIRPKPSNLPRLSEARFEKLMREQGARRLS